MIRSHDDAKMLLERMEMYACSKRIIDSGVLPKFVNGKLEGNAPHTLIRKQVKAYVSRKFPSAEVKLVHAGPKIFISPEQSKYIRFISNSNREHAERRRVIEHIDGAREAIEQLSATIRTMYGKIDLVRETSGNYSILVRCTGDGIRHAISQFEYVGILLTTLDTLKSKLDVIMLAIPDIDNAYERGLVIKRQREEEQARRRIVEVQEIIDMMRGTRVEEVAEIPAIQMTDDAEFDDPLPIITNEDLADEERAEALQVRPEQQEAMQMAAATAPREVLGLFVPPIPPEPVQRDRGEIRGQTARAVVMDEATHIRGGGLAEALGLTRRRVPVPVEGPTRRANPVAQAQMNDILRRLGHNV